MMHGEDQSVEEESKEEEEKQEEATKLKPQYLRTLQRRREEELKIIAKYDSLPLGRHEAWFLIDADWVADWLKFVNAGPPPSLDEGDEGEEQQEASDGHGDGKPFPGLEKVKHYRGVNPTVWHLYKEFYGMDESPAVLRYEVNIYAEEPSPKTRLESHDGPVLRAQYEASQIRAKLYPQEIFDVDEKICCCTRTYIDTVMICLFTCCARTRKIQYKRLVQQEEEEYDGDDDIDAASNHINTAKGKGKLAAITAAPDNISMKREDIEVNGIEMKKNRSDTDTLLTAV
eukprot:CAMPEP_0206417538 /NCGR_PEP_ID=MMETSP0294-20121207/37385_1 /ASSEMBLY_ACC=CAM_ASM_000327 /TAXON_ID=39354 /ORGANISM="Heterosigma akashiwo, Strain CCMP2393" /LENGTH=285 /DNA_ID=CAMNT_0053880369 /DNA_START=182 /DNA_END=1040 /DNA_ORIENTATION=+